MAEAAVEFLVGSIGSLLEKEIAYLGAVRGEIQDLKLELESMRSFLRDADKCKDQNEGLRLWAAQVRDIAYKTEDTIDEFMYRMGMLRRGGGGLTGFFVRVVCLPKEVLVKHRISIKLQEIKVEIQTVAERSKRYDLGRIEEGLSSHGSSTWVQNVGESSFFIEEEDVVGIKKEKDLLLKWLMDGEMQRIVISVVGMGGSGKTTLVSKAYNDHAVKRFFHCHAWVTVSQNFVIEDLFRSLIKEFFVGKKERPLDLSTMGYKQLVETLVDFLHEKRYALVLDDVWTNNIWRQINVALPDGRHGSRIMITTRKEDIATYPYGVGSHVLHALSLTKCDAWTLFCNKAFSNEPNKCCPPELENLARALVEKCEGLPLAIVALGGLMASKDKSELKWRDVYDSLNWHLSNNPMLEVVKTILSLSFNDLPYYLKYCFLYCCRFPGDHWIGAGRLVRLWMAEGFIEERRGLTPEEVGKSYLKELITRSLIQIVKKTNYLRTKVCKLHDLMRELALSISERDNFCSVYDLQGMKEEGQTRRLSILKFDTKLQIPINVSQVRSFTAFNFDKSSNLLLDALLSNFRLLRVLDLKDAPIDNVPKTLGTLFNLRYLNLTGTRIKLLPKSLGRLENLLTLDIRKTKVTVIPDGIDNLHNLRHLMAYSIVENEQFNYVVGTRVPSDVWKLKNLQELTCIEANSEIVRRMGNMTQLRRIELMKVREEDELALCASIEKLKLLRRLLVMVTNEEEILRMDALSSVPPLLRKLTLVGRLSCVPRWFHSSIRNVVYLHLHWSRLTEDPIPYISGLPNLNGLTLVNAYDHGKTQLCFTEGFYKLQYLSLLVLPELAEIIIAKGVMPSLLWLKLHVCVKLKSVPHGIEHLTDLEHLDLKDVSAELIESIRGEEAVDRPRVSHIPEIYNYHRTALGYNYESLS